MSKTIFISAVLLAFGGCAAVTSVPYQQAKAGWWAGWQGYLDQEIAPGVYIIEVSQIGGYVHDMNVLKAHWARRARELCPNGYSGSCEEILPAQARIKEFRCELVYCQRYPMASGVVHCRGKRERVRRM